MTNNEDLIKVSNASYLLHCTSKELKEDAFKMLKEDEIQFHKLYKTHEDYNSIFWIKVDNFFSFKKVKIDHYLNKEFNRIYNLLQKIYHGNDYHLAHDLSYLLKPFLVNKINSDIIDTYIENRYAKSTETKRIFLKQYIYAYIKYKEFGCLDSKKEILFYMKKLLSEPEEYSFYLYITSEEWINKDDAHKLFDEYLTPYIFRKCKSFKTFGSNSFVNKKELIELFDNSIFTLRNTFDNLLQELQENIEDEIIEEYLFSKLNISIEAIREMLYTMTPHNTTLLKKSIYFMREIIDCSKDEVLLKAKEINSVSFLSNDKITWITLEEVSQLGIKSRDSIKKLHYRLNKNNPKLAKKMFKKKENTIFIEKNIWLEYIGIKSDIQFKLCELVKDLSNTLTYQLLVKYLSVKFNIDKSGVRLFLENVYEKKFQRYNQVKVNMEKYFIELSSLKNENRNTVKTFIEDMLLSKHGVNCKEWISLRNIVYYKYKTYKYVIDYKLRLKKQEPGKEDTLFKNLEKTLFVHHTLVEKWKNIQIPVTIIKKEKIKPVSSEPTRTTKNINFLYNEFSIKYKNILCEISNQILVKFISLKYNSHSDNVRRCIKNIIDRKSIIKTVEKYTLILKEVEKEKNLYFIDEIKRLTLLNGKITDFQNWYSLDEVSICFKVSHNSIAKRKMRLLNDDKNLHDKMFIKIDNQTFINKLIWLDYLGINTPIHNKLYNLYHALLEEYDQNKLFKYLSIKLDLHPHNVKRFMDTCFESSNRARIKQKTMIKYYDSLNLLLFNEEEKQLFFSQSL